MRAPIFCVARDCHTRHRHHSTCSNDSCSGCMPRVTRHPSHLCLIHERKLAEDILQIPKLYQDLGSALIPPDMGMQPKVSGGNFKHNSFPFNDAAAQLRKQVQSTLTSLTTQLSKQRKVSSPSLTSYTDANITILCSHLYSHIDYITASKALARRTSSVISYLSRNAYRVAFPSDTRTIDIGQCPELIRVPIQPVTEQFTPDPEQQYIQDDDWWWAEVQCRGTVRAKMRREDSLLPSEVVCSHFPDHHTWNSRQWLRLRKQLQQQNASDSLPA